MHHQNDIDRAIELITGIKAPQPSPLNSVFGAIPLRPRLTINATTCIEPDEPEEDVSITMTKFVSSRKDDGVKVPMKLKVTRSEHMPIGRQAYCIRKEIIAICGDNEVPIDTDFDEILVSPTRYQEIIDGANRCVPGKVTL